jgi:hypothetical protein
MAASLMCVFSSDADRDEIYAVYFEGTRFSESDFIP